MTDPYSLRYSSCTARINSSFRCLSACSSASIAAYLLAACCASSSPITTCPAGFAIMLHVNCSFKRRLCLWETCSETIVTRVTTALTLCLSTPSRNNLFLGSLAFALDCETQKTMRGSQSTDQHKGGCKIQPQRSYTIKYNVPTLNTLISVPTSPSQVSSFGHPVTRTTYTHSLALLPPNPLYWIIRVTFPLPIQSPYLIIRGPIPIRY